MNGWGAVRRERFWHPRSSPVTFYPFKPGGRAVAAFGKGSISMKISLNWLNTYLDRPIDVDEAVESLTHAGFPVEEFEPVTVSGGEDTWLDVEVTSNRCDCLCHVGVAREVCAATGRTLRYPDCELLAGKLDGEDVGSLATVRNEALEWCPMYTARVIRGVKIGPSPQWMVDALEAIGQPSVNNVVDVTNFVMHELGQPLHAFDMKLLEENTIVVRAAVDGEQITAIDGTKHTLNPKMLVIADAVRPVAVAGVMGGLDTEIGEQTMDVLLEAAVFDQLVTRRTSRTLKLFSDSSYRFERGIDWEGVDRASRRAAKLIVETAGGKIATGVIREGRGDPPRREIVMRIARCDQLLGYKVPGERMIAGLERLGLSPRVDDAKGVVACAAPSFRLDLHREVDIIEEVARLHGLENVPVEERIEIVARAPQPRFMARQKLGQVLTAHGYHEAVTFSFVNPKQGRPHVADGAQTVMIEDERRKAEPMLRPSLIPSLMVCRKSNQDVGNAGVRLYETASTWVERGGGIVETEQLALLCDAPEGQEALRDLRGTIEELIAGLMGEVEVSFEAEPAPMYAAGASVAVEGRRIGEMGLVSAAEQKLFDLQMPVCVAAIDLTPLLERFPPRRMVETLARFPGIERDLSVVVDEQVPWSAIARCVDDVAPPMLESVNFITTYRGKQIGKGRKSVSFRMVYRDPAKTLRHDEVDPQVSAVVEKLKAQVGAEIRG